MQQPPPQNVDLREFRAAYLAEVDEYLGAVNGLLLAIETASRARKSSPRDLRELLRLLHTLKGLSATVGIESIVVIAHRMETLLRAADRAGGHALANRTLEALIDGTRAIETRVRAVANGQPAPEPAQDTLDALDAAAIDISTSPSPASSSSSSAAAASSMASPTFVDAFVSDDDDDDDARDIIIASALNPKIAAKLTASEREQLVQGTRAGLRGVSIDFAPTPAKATSGHTITTVRDRLGSVGEIVRVLPMAMPRSDATPGGLVFTLILLTSESDEAIARLTSISQTDIHEIAAARPHPRAVERHPSGALAGEQQRQERQPQPQPQPQQQQHHRQQQLVTEQAHRPLGVLRVEVGRIDDAIDKLTGLIVTRARLSHAVAKLRLELGVNTSDLETILADNKRQLRDLRGAILRVRMVPITAVLDRLPLVIRGLGRTTGKQVRLVLDEGGGAELDKTVAERIFPALVHILRNAVDHGIEDTDERARVGKPEQGTITVSSSARNNRLIEIRVQDDGRGVNRKQIEARIVRNKQEEDDDGEKRRSNRGKRSDAENGADSESSDGSSSSGGSSGNATLLDLICRPGLSTREQIDTTSGRGVGMDIVRKIVVDGLGGELALETSIGKGTTFVLRVPLTIAIVDAFAVLCAGQRFVVPVPVVDEIVELDPTKIMCGPRTRGREICFFSRRGETIPIVDLAHALGVVVVPAVAATSATSTSSVSTPSSTTLLSSSSSNDNRTTTRRRPQQALIVRRGYDDLVAFAIDGILGQQETVVRPLVDPLVSVVGVAGSADLGDGSATLVLDLLGLCTKLSHEAEHFAA